MKKFIAIALLALTTACAQPETSSMGSGMMCEKCPCCQKMMESGMKMDGMKDGMMKSGMQCPMMKSGASKDGMKCGCCQGMMGGEMKKQSTPAAKESTVDHNAHHPAQ